ncbi:MAG: Hsp20/alpha crystallin family protein [Verrucomicrobiota bacterium]
MKLIRYAHPLGHSFGRTFGDMERLLRSPFVGLGHFGRLLDTGQSQGVQAEPSLDVGLYEDDENYYARVELPGFKKSEVKLELDDGNLTVSCERKSVTEGAEEKTDVVFSRAMSVPDGIRADQVAAKLEDGVLTITLPKAEERKTREIKVK